MTEFWLVRHGQTDWNLTGRWQGQASSAPGLNDLGVAQALAARDQLSGRTFSAIYTSDLLRARQTAGLLGQAFGLTVSLEPRLREINLGIWEGMLSTDIAAQYPLELEERSRAPLLFRAPGGETLGEVSLRVLAAVGEIAAKNRSGSILLVSHGVSLALIICHLEKYPLAEVYEHIPANAQPYCVNWPE